MYGGDRVPAEVTDEGCAGAVVGRVGGHEAEERGIILPGAQGR